ncbi:hypothetical protein AB4400_30045, partial [Vibrio sp. 10N.261.48.A2]
QRIKTLGFHDLLLHFSSRYKLHFLAGLHAISINQGANINQEVACLQRDIPELDTQKAATAIIFHSQFGKTDSKKG